MGDPRQLGNASDQLTREEAMRLERYRSSVGDRVAFRRLRVGKDTLYAARDGGRLQKKTRTRLLERLAELEAETTMTREEQLADTIPPPPPTMPAPASIKACRCGREFARDEWNRLSLVGFQDDGEGGKFELRDCDVCASTLAIEATG